MSSKPFLVIQLRPEDAAADSELAAIKRYGDLSDHEAVRLRVERHGLPKQELERYSGIIVGGSPFDVSTPEAEKSAIQKSIEAGFKNLLDEVVSRDYPFLGCCSGNGLLGRHLGAGISSRYSEDVGGADVHRTEAGRRDPLLRGTPDRFRVLLGHKEACDELPPGSVLLVEGAECPVQMFRVGSNVYATQFHPEGDPQGFQVRIKAYKDSGYFPPEEAGALAARIAKEHTPHAHRILRNFTERYRTAD